MSGPLSADVICERLDMALSEAGYPNSVRPEEDGEGFWLDSCVPAETAWRARSLVSDRRPVCLACWLSFPNDKATVTLIADACRASEPSMKDCGASS